MLPRASVIKYQIRRGMEDMAAFFDLRSARGICHCRRAPANNLFRCPNTFIASPGLPPPQAASESPRLYIVTAFGGCSIGRLRVALHATEFQKAPILPRTMVGTFQGMGERYSELGHFEQQYFCWKETGSSAPCIRIAELVSDAFQRCTPHHLPRARVGRDTFAMSAQCQFRRCVVTRRHFPVGANPTRPPLQPEAKLTKGVGAGRRS